VAILCISHLQSFALGSAFLKTFGNVNLTSICAANVTPPSWETGNRVIQFHGYPFVFLSINAQSNELQNPTDSTLQTQRPWYASKLAIVGYSILLIVIILSIRQYEVIRYRMRNQIRIAAIEASKLKDLDNLKSKFFSNISHELRTPLTLIKGPVEQLLDQIDDPEQKKLLMLMKLNTERLLELINQLLDLSKLESGQYKIRVAKGDVAPFIRGFAMSFASLANQKNISLKFFESPSVRKPEFKNNFYFDIDVIEKILTNLISNAFKFTPEGGKITVTICQRTLKTSKIHFEIIIKDTGIGIAKEHLPYIYNRFYQVDDSSERSYEGTGIGLAYVKELLNAHKGKISVMSKPGSGTVFRLRFPVGTDAYAPEDILKTDYTETPEIPEKTENFNNTNTKPKNTKEELAAQTKNPLILIIEDYQDVREYIRSSLGKNYAFLEAENARAGIQIALNTIPDLIICDVMMPGMNGFELCKQMKTNDKTSHIPVILLTARVNKNDIVSGLETGADDYITKPFNAKELKARTKNIIQTRRLLRKKFDKNAIIKPAEISVTSRDKAFMENLLAIAEKNISSENFTVEDFSNAVGMSPSQLHRKLKAVVNQSAVQFLRSVKMHRAKELLEKDAGNIAEISYMVGFGDPGYFTRTFKNFFGMLPSEIKKNS
jgi:signal transduction histidine kinase/DNA-binding response OmpR family regulator